MNRCTSPILVAMGCLLTLSANAADAIQETRFVGSLSRTVGDEQIVLRDFEVLLLRGSDTFFSVLDDEKDGCPWPESFGRLDVAGGSKPHLVYSYSDSVYTLPLPALQLDIPGSAEVGSEWSQDGWAFEIFDSANGTERQLWKIRGTERRGRRSQVATDSAGLLASATMDVFMGQGDKFELNIERTSDVTMPPEKSVRVESMVASLISLQASLGRRKDSQLAELSARQTQLAVDAIDSLSGQARDTPLQEAVLRIRRDVELQQQRIQLAMQRKEKLINSDAPEFSLNLITGGSLESSTLKGHTVVLHFWAYSDKPLSEPYGQVGYLEFLFNKRKADQLKVVGVATNDRLQQPEQVRLAKRSVRKLAEFMNLSYPIGYDNGALIRELVDPRESGGDLPMWVVISPEGKVVHYHAGFYEVDRRAGLRSLTEVLDSLK